MEVDIHGAENKSLVEVDIILLKKETPFFYIFLFRDRLFLKYAILYVFVVSTITFALSSLDLYHFLTLRDALIPLRRKSPQLS